MDTNKKFRTLDVITLSFAHFSHDIFTAFLSPILPLLIEKLSISYFLAGLLNVIRGIPSLLNPFIGIFVDKNGGKIFIILGPTITAIFMTLIGVAPNYGFVVLFLLFAGINSTFFHVPVPVMVKNVSGNKSGLGMSFFMVGGELARSLGPVIVLWAVSVWSLEGIWRLIPLGIFASAILFLKLKNLQYPKISSKTKKEKISKTIAKIFMFFLIMFLFMLFVWLTKVSLTYFLPTYLKAKGNSLWISGIALSIIQFSGLIGAFLGGYISDKIGRSKTLLLAWIFTPFLTLIFINAKSLFLIFLSLVLIGLFMYMTTPVMLAYVHDIKCNRPAFLNSMFMITNFGASAIATLIIGFISDKISLIQTFSYTPILGLLSIPFIFLLHKEFKKINSNLADKIS